MTQPRKVLALLCALASSAQATELVPFTANYASEYGVLSATGVRTLKKSSDGNWAFENRANAVFAEVLENSTFALRRGQVTPLTYQFKNPFNSKRNLSLTFNWPQAKVDDDERKTSLPLSGEIYDKLSYQQQMAKDVCTNPEKFGGKDYTVVDIGKLKTYRVEFVDRQPLQTRVGTLDTYHLRQFRPDKRDGKDTQIWLATDFNCVLTRLDQHEGDGIIRLDLTSANVNGVEVKGK